MLCLAARYKPLVDLPHFNQNFSQIWRIYQLYVINRVCGCVACLVYTSAANGGRMTSLIKAFRSNSKSDFTTKVLNRYSSKKAVGSFARGLFSTENAASINERFANAKRKLQA